jgi:sugar lactone lactonase YvrE
MPGGAGHPAPTITTAPRIDADRGCFACTLGGAVGRTLYIVTAQWPSDFRTPTGQVLAVQVTVPSASAATER